MHNFPSSSISSIHLWSQCTFKILAKYSKFYPVPNKAYSEFVQKFSICREIKKKSCRLCFVLIHFYEYFIALLSYCHLILYFMYMYEKISRGNKKIKCNKLTLLENKKMRITCSQQKSSNWVSFLRLMAAETFDFQNSCFYDDGVLSKAIAN